jgi:hypothetical protein
MLTWLRCEIFRSHRTGYGYYCYPGCDRCILVDIYRRFGSLKMNAARFYQTARRNIAEDSNQHLYIRFRGKREDTEKAACTVKANQGNINSAP